MSDSPNAGQVVVVTGAASGIGRALCEQLAAAGASAVAVDLDAEKLAWTESVDRIVSFAGDITEEATNTAMVALAVAEFGRLDAVALNAGLPSSGSIESLPLADFDRVMEVNLRGTVLGTRAAIPALRESGGGAVIATASVSGLGGDPNMWAYNAAKGGVINFVRSAAMDLARDAIRVNAVCPGPIRTGMTEVIEKAAPAVHEALRSHIPLQRWGEAREVAAVIAFLASPAASFVTGAIIPVDGGVSAGTGQFLPHQLPAGGGSSEPN
jgi:meso-butanediol dehydrogenase/(S,S)-butanediol dehydrogenase/diacetyl reductase